MRFLYIARHRELFRDEVLAELLPPLEADGTSHLWEAFGRHFTGLSYAEADLLSSTNKDFVKDLFPTGNVYASVLSPEAQAVIGKVGAQTRGVEKMLRRIGFRYAERVDPFDGGPHFVADTDEVTLVKATRRVPLSRELEPGAPCERGLVSRCDELRCVASDVAFVHAGVRLPAAVSAHLGVAAGDALACLPLP